MFTSVSPRAEVINLPNLRNEKKFVESAILKLLVVGLLLEPI